jgi:hypothetical protein
VQAFVTAPAAIARLEASTGPIVGQVRDLERGLIEQRASVAGHQKDIDAIRLDVSGVRAGVVRRGEATTNAFNQLREWFFRPPVRNQRDESPIPKSAVAASLAAEVATLKAQLPDTIAKVGTSDTTLSQMVQGEVGKLIAGSAAPSNVGGGGEAVSTTDRFAHLMDGVLGREGGYANNPADRGGETMWGVTIARARASGYTGAMRAMSREQAVEIYRLYYWQQPGFDRMMRSTPGSTAAPDAPASGSSGL